jgi:hypothetical protein
LSVQGSRSWWPCWAGKAIGQPSQTSKRSRHWRTGSLLAKGGGEFGPPLESFPRRNGIGRVRGSHRVDDIKPRRRSRASFPAVLGCSARSCSAFDFLRHKPGAFRAANACCSGTAAETGSSASG